MATSFWGALAGALVGGLVTVGVWLANHRAEARSRQQMHRDQAYVDLVSSSIRVAERCHAALLTVRARSGLDEGIALLLRMRSPLVPMDVLDWIAGDAGSMWEAWTRVQTHGTVDGIAAANRVLDAQAALSATLTDARPAGWRGQLVSTVRPLDITAAQQQFDTARRALFTELRALVALARAESRRDPSPQLQLLTASDSR